MIAMIINIIEAQRFLDIVSPTPYNHIFQTFDDNKLKNPMLVKTFVGDLETFGGRLGDLNERGAGVFFTVNRSKTNRRLKKDMCMAMAVWQEDDIGTDKIPDLEPSLVVETSSGKFHRYWLIKDGTANIRLWERVQQSLVDNWDSDKNVKDVSRVMRLPGFYHNKNEPFKTRMVTDINDISKIKYYAFEDLCEYFLDKDTACDGDNGDVGASRGDKTGEFNPVTAINEIMSSDNFHGAQVSLAMHYANYGMSYAEIVAILKGFFNMVMDKDARWESRYAEIERAVRSAIDKKNGEEQEEILTDTEKGDIVGEIDNRDGVLKLDRCSGFKLGVIADNVMEFMRYPNYEIAMETALHCVNVMAGNYYSFDRVPCHRKTVLLADQGVGKNIVKIYMSALCTSLAHKNDTVNPSFLKFIGAGDYTGPKQLHMELQEFGSRSMISSEAGHTQVTTAGDRSGLKGYENQVLASPPNSPQLPRRQNSGKGEDAMRHLYSMCISVLHESVSENYVALFGDKSLFSDGSVSRTNILFIDDRINIEGRNRKNGTAEVSDEILRTFWGIAMELMEKGDVLNKHLGIPRVKEVEVEDEGVWSYLDDLETYYINEINKTDDVVIKAIMTRKIVRIKQTCRLLAVAEDYITPRVCQDMVKWAEMRTNRIDNTLMFHSSRGKLSDVMVQITQKFVMWATKYLNGNSSTKMEKMKIGVYGVRLRRLFITNNNVIMRDMRTQPQYRYMTDMKLFTSLMESLEYKGYISVLKQRKLDGGKYTNQQFNDIKIRFIDKIDPRAYRDKENRQKAKGKQKFGTRQSVQPETKLREKIAGKHNWNK